MSPELISPEQFGLKTGRPTKSSDCYALGMVIYEIISGKPPFYEDGEITASLKVLKGKHPRREDGFTDGLWKTMEQCWVSHPSNRPSIEGVLQCLEMCSNTSQPFPGMDDGMEVEFNGRLLSSPTEEVPCHLNTLHREERQREDRCICCSVSQLSIDGHRKSSS